MTETSSASSNAPAWQLACLRQMPSRLPRSIGMNGCILDYLAPLDHLGLHRAAQLFRRAADRLQAKLEKLLFRLLLREQPHYLAIQLLDDGGGGARRREYAHGQFRRVTGQARGGYGGHPWNQRRGLGAGNREEPE